MNISIFCSSLKYININYTVAISLATWIYDDYLIKYNYNSAIFLRALAIEDMDTILLAKDFTFTELHLENYLCMYTKLKGCKQSVDVIKILLDNQADIHFNNDISLINASRCNNTEVILLLLEYGANVHAHNEELLYWICYYRNEQLLKFILSKYNNIDITIRNDEAFSKCLHYNNFKMLKLLADYTVNKACS